MEAINKPTACAKDNPAHICGFACYSTAELEAQANHAADFAEVWNQPAPVTKEEEALARDMAIAGLY